MSDGLRAEVEDRVRRLDLEFNRFGLDKFGVARDHLEWFYTLLGWLYRNYFRVTPFNAQRVPTKGPALLIGNHSGGIPVDAGMLAASLFFDHDPPIHAHGMVEYFVQRWPFFSAWYYRLGHLPGLPEHAQSLLEDGRHLMVFPEGARGTGKVYKDRYQLVRFGTGFMRLALMTGAPVCPFAFIGGEEAVPTMFHLTRLAKLLRAPYLPVPPQLLPIPFPVACHVHFGEPMEFEGDGTEPDDVIERYVELVRTRIRELIEEGLSIRGRAFRFQKVPADALAGQDRGGRA